MNDSARIEGRIADLKAELGRVEGTQTEVYSRIVGYYRSVRNWNAGKREEYAHRLAFGMPSLAVAPPLAASSIPVAHKGAAGHASAGSMSPATRIERSGMIVFTRKACPNCPPVASYVERSGLPAVFVDVDAEEGLALARHHGVMATPTVVGIGADGGESFRAHGLGELKSCLEPEFTLV